jgi:hypothetical protein
LYPNATGGVNIYNNEGQEGVANPQDPNLMWKAHPDYVGYFKDVYSDTNIKDIIWGHHITEESTSIHPKNPNNFPIVWDSKTDAVWMQTPVSNVTEAINKFRSLKSQYGIPETKQKLVVMEAYHHHGINDNTDLTVYNNNIPNDMGNRLYTSPQDYIKIPNPNGVFFEGSYTQFPHLSWIDQDYSKIESDAWHYLGPIKSIDYAKQYYNRIHKVINSQLNESKYWAHIHSEQSIPNANWLWFQTYTSIIHGVEGIWFWDLNHSYTAVRKFSDFS